MQLFLSLNEPITYVAIKIDYPNKNHIMLIGDGKKMSHCTVTDCVRYRDGGTTVLKTESGHRFTRMSPMRDENHNLMTPDRWRRPMVEADDNDPVWKLIDLMTSEPRMKKSTPIQKWSEVDDSILRGWKKDKALLLDVFPKRSMDEIRDRMSFLKE